MDPLSYKQPPATDYYVLDYHVLSFTNMNVLHNIKTWASGERPANPLLTFIQTASTADGVENTNPFTDGQRDPT